MNLASPEQSFLLTNTTNVWIQAKGQTMTSAATEPEILSKPKFSIQRLSIDSAVSPLLNRPTAPFDKTERKRAHTSAVFYSECFLRGIEPVAADTAAEDAQGLYDKWWKKAAYHKDDDDDSPSRSRTSFQDAPERAEISTHVGKWRRTDGVGDDASIVSSNLMSATSSHTEPSSLASEDESTHDRGTKTRQPEALLFRRITSLAATTPSQLDEIKMRLISDLRASGGSTATSTFLSCIDFLASYYRSKSWDGRGLGSSAPFKLEGQWLTLSKPTYNDLRGRTDKGEYLYSLGRLSFDMFRPTNLVCSLQATFNSVRPMNPLKPDRPLHVPRRLLKEIEKGNVHLRTYE